jgi:hypothetical protein
MALLLTFQDMPELMMKFSPYTRMDFQGIPECGKQMLVKLNYKFLWYARTINAAGLKQTLKPRATRRDEFDVTLRT